MKTTLLATLLFTTLSIAHAKGPLVQEGYFIEDHAKIHLDTFKKNPDLVLDHMDDHGYEVYGPHGLGEYLKDLNIEAMDLITDQKDAGGYPSPEEIEQKLREVARAYPDIVSMFSIGTSVNGRPLWMLKISDNVENDEREPEFKYIANMHGDEIVGRELMVEFIRDLVRDYKKGRKTARNLIDNTEIYVMPSMNPDGAASRRRGNGSWTDLNRDFPDFTTSDDQNDPSGRQPETKAVMEFQAERNFALSANFHGGAEVVNYPWDTTGHAHPFENLIKTISLEYASRVPGMRDSRRFEGGIVNGYQWYEVDGGMQDWSYNWHNDLQVTIELSNSKWPDYSQVARYYRENKESIVKYAQKIHQGMGFVLRDGQKGSVSIRSESGLDLGEYNFENGEFYKVLPLGNYTWTVKLSNGSSKSFTGTVKNQISENGNYQHLDL